MIDLKMIANCLHTKLTFLNHKNDPIVRACRSVVGYLTCTEEIRVRFSSGPFFLNGVVSITRIVKNDKQKT
jgi:hypothetical protein